MVCGSGIWGSFGRVFKDRKGYFGNVILLRDCKSYRGEVWGKEEKNLWVGLVRIYGKKDGKYGRFVRLRAGRRLLVGIFLRKEVYGNRDN